jgi:hypothetical protein
MRRVFGVLALVVILSAAAAAVGGEQTAAQTAPTVALKSATLKSKWKESWLTGSVRFSGTVSSTADLRVSLRPRSGGRLAAAVTLPAVQPGPFGGELTLPARLLPKVYRLTVSGTSGDGQIAPVHRDVTLKAPPEGIVDDAYISATKGGKRVFTLKGLRKQLFARFHFVVRPKNKNLHAAWFSPDFKWRGRAEKTYKVNVDTFVLDTTPRGLMKGVWFCYLRASNGTVIKKARIRVS